MAEFYSHENYPSILECKENADNLCVKKKIKNNEALNLVAKDFGYKNWAALKAYIKKEEIKEYNKSVDRIYEIHNSSGDYLQYEEERSFLTQVCRELFGNIHELGDYTKRQLSENNKEFGFIIDDMLLDYKLLNKSHTELQKTRYRFLHIEHDDHVCFYYKKITVNGTPVTYCSGRVSMPYNLSPIDKNTDCKKNIINEIKKDANDWGMTPTFDEERSFWSEATGIVSFRYKNGSRYIEKLVKKSLKVDVAQKKDLYKKLCLRMGFYHEDIDSALHTIVYDNELPLVINSFQHFYDIYFKHKSQMFHDIYKFIIDRIYNKNLIYNKVKIDK